MANPALSCIATTYSPWLGVQVHVPADQLSTLLKSPDAVQVAAQTGRLDLLTATLAALAIFLAAIGLIGGWFISVNAARTARKVAENEIATELPKLLPAMLKTILEKNPSLMVQCLREHPYLLRTATEEVNRTLFGGVADKMVEKMMQAIQSDAGNGNGAG